MRGQEAEEDMPESAGGYIDAPGFGWGFGKDMWVPKGHPDLDDFLWRAGMPPIGINSTDDLLGFKQDGPVSNLFEQILRPEVTSNDQGELARAILKGQAKLTSGLSKDQGELARVIAAINQDPEEEIWSTRGRLDRVGGNVLENAAGTGLLDRWYKRFDTPQKENTRDLEIQGQPASGLFQVKFSKTDIPGDFGKFQLSEIKVSNFYLKQLVELTVRMLQKDSAGDRGGPVHIPPRPLPRDNEGIQGDMSGTSFTDSRSDFYGSAYSMHTPSVPA